MRLQDSTNKLLTIEQKINKLQTERIANLNNQLLQYNNLYQDSNSQLISCKKDNDKCALKLERRKRFFIALDAVLIGAFVTAYILK